MTLLQDAAISYGNLSRFMDLLYLFVASWTMFQDPLIIINLTAWTQGVSSGSSGTAARRGLASLVLRSYRLSEREAEASTSVSILLL